MKLNEFQRILREHVHLPVPQKTNHVQEIKQHYPDIVAVEPSKNRGKRIGFSLLSFVMSMAMLTVVYLGTQVKTVITVDINPAVSLSVNYFNRVIDVEAIDDDGVAWIAQLEHKTGSPNDVIGELLVDATNLGYLSESTENFVLLGIAGKTYQGEENMALALASLHETNEYLSLMVISRHMENSATTLYGGFVLMSEEGLDLAVGDLFDRMGVSQTTMLTTSPDYDYFDDIPVFDPDVESAISSDNKEGYSYASPALSAESDAFLSEEEFLELIQRYQVSEAKMTLVLAIVLGLPGYTQEADIAILLNQPIQNLMILYVQIP